MSYTDANGQRWVRCTFPLPEREWYATGELTDDGKPKFASREWTDEARRLANDALWRFPVNNEE